MALLICKKCNNLHGLYHKECVKCRGPLETANVNEDMYREGNYSDKSKS